MIDFKALGLNVIPCKPKSKLPALAWKEFQTKPFVGQLAQNNAVICGVTSGNLVVIDLDDKSLATTVFDDFEAIKKSTLVVETSKGYHVYVRPTGSLPNTMRVNHPDGRHIDIQSQGAYVVAPNSIHPDTGKPYQIISSVEQIKQVNLDGILNHLTNLGFKGVNEGLPSIPELVKNVPTGNRNNAAFKYAAHLIGTVNLPKELVLQEIKRWATDLGFTPRPGELESVIESALKRVKRPTTENPKYAPEGPLLKLRDLNSKFEGKEVEFAAYILNVGERGTVSTELSVQCPNCHDEDIVTGSGYVNPKIPKCPTCKINMEERQKLKTVDMKEIYLQELPEDVNYENPDYFIARVIGENIFKVAINARKKFKAKFKSFSMNAKGKKENEVILLIDTVEDLEECRDAVLTEQEKLKIKEQIDSNHEEFLQKLIDSYHPGIVGHRRIKEALLLSAAWGSPIVDRQIINIGIVGNKSKSKSKLLKRHAIITGGTYVVGMGSTKAGLGIGVINLPDGTRVHKPGPLVTSSGRGLSCDEADKMNPEDLKVTLECMEHEQITISKATSTGHQTLPARTPIIIGANFKYGDWDDEQGIMENLNFPDNFLSRFALIFRILDYDDQTNQRVADKLLQLNEDEAPFFTVDELRVFLNTVKSLTPGLTREAKLRIKDFYIKMSKKRDVKEMAMEPRQLEDMIRMSTARAKLLMKESADTSDVDAVIELYKASMESWGLDISTGVMQLKLQTDEQSKEQCLMQIVEACKNTDGNFNQSEVVDKWANTKWFEDKRDAINFFNRHVPDKFILNRDGTYHLSHGV